MAAIIIIIILLLVSSLSIKQRARHQGNYYMCNRKAKWQQTNKVENYFIRVEAKSREYLKWSMMVAIVIHLYWPTQHSSSMQNNSTHHRILSKTSSSWSSSPAKNLSKRILIAEEFWIFEYSSHYSNNSPDRMCIPNILSQCSSFLSIR